MKYVSHKKIEDLLYQVLLKYNVEGEVAIYTAKGLVDASLRGVDSHGIRLFFHYLEGLKSGRLNPNPQFKLEQTSKSTAILDADHTFGHAAGMQAMQYSIELAQKAGSGHVAVKNSSHCGALAYFALESCKHDMIGVAYTHATSRLKSSNGVREFFGNNPMCFTAPMKEEEPFCYDGANSTITFNEVRRCKDLNLELPYGVVADKDGEITTDPNKAEQLIAIGDYKGYGLSMIVDIFCGLLTGMPVGRDVSKMFGDENVLQEKRYLGQFYSSYKVDSFVSAEIFKDRLQNLANNLRKEPALDTKQTVMVPGDPEKIKKKERLLKGIPIPTEDYRRFKEIEEKFSLGDII